MDSFVSQVSLSLPIINLNFLSLLSVNNSDVNSKAQCLSEVFNEIFVKKEICFDLQVLSSSNDDVFDENSNDTKYREEKEKIASTIVNEILIKNKGTYIVKVNKISTRFSMSNSAVIIVSSASDFYSLLNLNVKSYLEQSDKPSLPTLLIYCDEVNIEDFESKTIFDRIYINPNLLIEKLNTYFVVKTPNGLSLMTLFLKREIYKGNSETFRFQPDVINSFDPTTLAWNGDFNKANVAIRMKSFKYYPVLEILKCDLQYECYYDKRQKRRQGFFFDLLNIISQHQNIRIITENSENRDIGVCDTNALVINFQSTLGKDPVIQSEIFLTTTYSEEKFQFIITPAESYSSYEKLTMPFDKTTWICLILTFLGAFVTIKTVNLLPNVVQHLVFGSNVKMPSYNVVSIFFGIGQTQIPAANFPRTILMFFIIFCLIFRTAYQGVLYELITTDVRKPLPETISELIKQNYTFYMTNSDRNDMMNMQLYTLMGEYSNWA